MSAQLWVVSDRSMSRIGIAGPIDFEIEEGFAESPEIVIDGMVSFSTEFKLSEESFRRFATIVGLYRYLRLRRQAIAKARGKNWRNVR